MIRRTVARAFGGSVQGKTAGAWPAGESTGSAAIERFLRDLHRALEEIAAGGGSPGSGAGSPESAAAAGPVNADRRLRLNRPETLPEGIEFALAGPAGAVRFLDTLLGFVRVIITGSGGDSCREEVLSLHPHAGAQRPVWKPLAAPGAARAGRRRTAFRFTSVADLAARYAAIASGDNI
jgi:hypothetical protein